MTALQREPINPPMDLDQELAIKAERLLGYSALRKKLGIAGPLGQVLRELSIEPFNAESVEAYKEAAWEAAAEENRQRFPGTQSNPQWERIPLAKCEEVWPHALHALSRAVTIAEACPGVTFFVDQLGGDPFLVAVMGDEEFFVDHWDEEGFTA